MKTRTIWVGIAAMAWSGSTSCQAALQVAHGVPRVGFAMQGVSADLQDFEPVVEADGSGEIKTAAWVEQVDLEFVRDTEYAKANPEAWNNYFQSLAVYSGIGVALAVISIIAAIVACCCSCFCCKEPVLKEYEDNGEILKPYEYPQWQTVLTYFCLVLFDVLLLTFMMLALVRGIQGLTEAQYQLLDAPDNVAAATAGIVAPIVTSSALVGKELVALLRSLNTTIAEKVDLGSVHNDFVCARELVTYLGNGTVEAANETLTNLANHLKTAPTQSQVNSTIDNASAQLQGVQGSLSAIESQLGAVADLLNNQVDLEDIEGSMQSLSSAVNTAMTSAGILKTGVDAYLTVLSDGQVPLTSAIQTLAGGPSLSANNIAPYTIAGLNNYETAYANFVTIWDSQDEDSLKAKASTAVTNFKALDVALASIDTKLVDTLNKVNAAPTLTALTTSLQNVQTALNNLDFSAVRSSLSSFTDFVGGINIKPLEDFVDELIALNQTAFPCIVNLGKVPQKVNDELVTLPLNVSDLSAQLDGLLSSIDLLNDAKAQLASVSDFDDLTAQIDQFRQMLADAESDKVSTLNQVQSLLSSIGSLGSSSVLDASNLNALRAAVQDARNLLADPSLADPPTDLLDYLDQLKQFKSEFKNDQGVALLNSKVGALKASSPSSQVCISGPASVCLDMSANPSVFSSCSVPTSCPYPYVELVGLQSNLEYLRLGMTGATPNLLSVSTLLGDVTGQASAIDTSCCSDLSTAKTLRSQSASGKAQVTAAKTEIGNASAQLESFKSEFANILSLKVTFDGFVNDLLANLDSVARELKTGLSLINSVIDIEARINELVFVSGVPLLNNLDGAKLLDIAENQGVEKLIVHILEQVNAAISKATPDAARIDGSQAADIASILDVVRDSDGSLRKVGTIYYFMQIAIKASPESFAQSPNSTNAAVIIPEEQFFKGCDVPSLFGCIQNNEISVYAGDDRIMCVTDACLRNTISFYNKAKLSEAVSAGGAPLPPLSREVSMALPLLAPAILIIIATLTFFIPSCGYTLTCCSAVMLPWLFLIYGAVLFPLVMMAADTCASLSPVVVSSVQVSAPSLCTMAGLGANFSDGICNVPVQPGFAGVNVSVQVDFPQIMRSVLQDCQGLSAANSADGSKVEPLQAIFGLFGVQASDIVQNQLVDLVENILPNQLNVTLKPAMKDVFYSLRTPIAEDIKTVSSAFGSALGCKVLSSSVSGIKDGLCVGFGDSLYWSVSGWYLIAWTALLLGMPLGVFAATRFRNIQVSREHMALFYKQTVNMISPRNGGHGEQVGVVVEDRPSMKDRLKGLGDSFKSRIGKGKVQANGTYDDTKENAV